MTWLRVPNQGSSVPEKVLVQPNVEALPQRAVKILPEGNEIKVLIADDHKMITDVFSLFLSQEYNMEVDTAENIDEAILLIKQKGPYDTVLLDLNMPGMNGIEGLMRAMDLNSGLPVAIITSNISVRMQKEIMQAGSAGIVLKTTHARSLANAINFMRAGEKYLPIEIVAASSSSIGQNSFNLSEKEILVLQELAQGKSNKEIARSLDLAEPTIKMHITSLCRKLEVRNRTHAVVVAREAGIV